MAELVKYDEESILPRQKIHVSLLSDKHQWPTRPEVNPSFIHLVQLNTQPRRDMARYKTILMNNTKDALDLWSSLCESRTLFRIPDTLKCDRTFATDNEDVYYLDAMDIYLNANEDGHARGDIPFVKISLAKRRFYAFSRRPGYFSEMFDRRRLKLWLPLDAREIKFSSDVDLYETYPTVEWYMDEVEQPPALPVPVPPVVFYYHSEIRAAQRARADGLQLTERQHRLLICLEKEYFVLFVAMWWSEAACGRRQYVLTEKTVEAVAQGCSGLPDDLGIMSTAVILQHMRTTTGRPARNHNFMCFKDNCMEESPFLWAAKDLGEFDVEAAPCGVRLWCVRDKRRITARRKGAKLFKRSTVLDKPLTTPDLEKIPGLADVVREHNWNAYGTMRVGDAIANLLRAYTDTRGFLDTMTRRGFNVHPQPFPSGAHHQVAGHSPVPRVTYYDYHHRDYENDRYQEDRRRMCVEGDRIRSPYYSPSPPPNYHSNDYRGRQHDEYRGQGYDGYHRGNDRCHRGEYRDLDAPVAPEPLQNNHPRYPREEVYEIRTPRATDRRGDGAGPSRETVAQRNGTTGEHGGNGAVLSTARVEALNSASGERPPLLIKSKQPAPGSWGWKLFEAERRAGPMPAKITTFTPGTPFLNVGSGGMQTTAPDQARREVNAEAQPHTGVTQSDMDYTRQRSGNVSWGFDKGGGTKRNREDLAAQGGQGVGKKARVETGCTEANRTALDITQSGPSRQPEQDPVLRSLMRRHPATTALTLHQKQASQK